MANDAKFNFYLNRQGARGQRGEKGDQGFSPSITVNTNTADEYTLLIQNEYDSLVTDNIRPTYDDRGGTYVRVDRTNNVQYFGSADIATTANYGEVKLAQASDLASTVDVGNSNVITVELLKTWFGGQIADNLVTTTNNVTIQGQKIFATPTRFMDTVRVGNRLLVSQEDTGTITFDTDETGTVIGTHLTSTGDASFSKNVTVDGTATIEGGLNVAGNAVISNPQLGNTTISGDLTTNADINIQGQKVHLQHTNPTMYLKNMNGVNEIEIFRGLFTAGNPSPADNYLNLGHNQLQLNLTGKAIKANGKDVATADTVNAIQSDLNIAKQDIIEAQGDIDNLQMNKQNKLTAGTGITIDADNVISATGGVVDIPIASSTTLGGIKVGENLTISEDGTLSATGGSTGDVSAAGNNTFTGENTFNGAVSLNGTNIAENLTVNRNLTSSGEINAVSIKTTGLRSNDIQTTTNKKYLTEADVDNQTIQVVNGKISSTTPISYLTRAQYDALEAKDANTMYVITDEEGGGGGSSITYTAEAPLSISADNVISIDTTDLGGTTLKKDASIVDYALDLTDDGTVGGTSKAARAESNESRHDAYMAFSGHNPSDDISTLWGPSQRKTDSWVELYLPDGVVPYSAAWTYGSSNEILPAVELLASNDGSLYKSLGSVTGVSTVTASMTFNTTDSYKYLRFEFRDACVTSAWGKFGLTSLKVKSSEVTTYTELFIGDNIDVTNGTMNVNLDEIGSEVNALSGEVAGLSGDVTTLSGKVTAVEGKTTDLESAVALKQNKLTAGDGISIVQKYANELEKVYYDSNGNVLSDVTNYEVKYGQRNNLFVYDNLNLSNKFEFSVRIPTSVLKSSESQLVINFSSTINNNTPSGAGIQILKRNSGLTYQMGLMTQNDNWRTNTTRSYDSVPDYFDVTVTRANASTENLHVKFQCPLDSNAYEFDWDDSTDYGGIFPLNSSGLHLMLAIGWGDPFYGDFSNINFSYASLGELKTTISSITPITNCVLAMPTAPTFDGTNVKVYSGTKVAIPNGLNADGTCKSNIVTLTADATINQSTFNGDVTLMLKSDGTIDQTAYSYFEVDDISTITTLTAYCWYYDRKTNNHYIASSTGAKQGPYQRIKIGSYNQATAATTKYFRTYRPIALENNNVRMVSREEFDALVARVAALEASINGSQSA